MRREEISLQRRVGYYSVPAVVKQLDKRSGEEERECISEKRELEVREDYGTSVYATFLTLSCSALMAATKPQLMSTSHLQNSTSRLRRPN